MTDRRTETVAQVAGIIREHGLDLEEAEELNTDYGWTFDVRWSDGDYTNDESYTRVRSATLTSEELDAAWKLAEKWRRAEGVFAGGVA